MSASLKGKREGLIPPPKHGVIPIRKSVKIGSKSMVMTIHESDTSITIYVGGKDVYCIDIQIMKSNLYEDSSIANFNKIRFDVDCSLGSNFVRGIDTNMILKFVITYIHNTYPFVKEMLFNDASTRTCDNGFNVNLSNMSYLLYGITWYQKHFDAYIKDKNDINKVNQNIKLFQEKKKILPWDYIKDSFTSFPISESEMKELYKNTSTWQDFFMAINNRIGISQFCIFISPWIENFINRFLKLNFMFIQFHLPIKDYKIDYSITEYVGGRRNTKRNKRLNQKK